MLNINVAVHARGVQTYLGTCTLRAFGTRHDDQIMNWKCLKWGFTKVPGAKQLHEAPHAQSFCKFAIGIASHGHAAVQASTTRCTCTCTSIHSKCREYIGKPRLLRVLRSLRPPAGLAIEILRLELTSRHIIKIDHTKWRASVKGPQFVTTTDNWKICLKI